MGASDIFDEVIQGGWGGILAWVADEREESLNVDFKGRNPTAPRDALLPEDKDVLAKAASGFANVDGGVLLLGLDTNKATKGDPNKLALAQTFLPDVVAFQRAVQKHLKDLNVPTIGGLGIEAIAEPGSARGIVAVLVPNSSAKPHRGAAPIRGQSDYAASYSRNLFLSMNFISNSIGLT